MVVGYAHVDIEAVSAERLLGQLFDPTVKIWLAAMQRAPDHPRAQTWGEILERHTARNGFRCRVAFERGTPLGFSYGYTGAPGQWWTDLVAAALEEAARERWIGGHFELVELHVHPNAQGRGIGGRLHDAILEDLPHRTALLSTQRGPTAAYALYRKRGWETLVEHFSFPQENVEYRIMGLELAERQPAARS